MQNGQISNGVVYAIPGEAFELAVKIMDEFDNSLDEIYSATITPLNSSNLFVTGALKDHC